MVILVKFPSFLRVLNVAGNQIAGINERKFISSAVNLQTLDMSDNNIEDITPRNMLFGSSEAFHVKRLSIRVTRVQSSPRGLKTLPCRLYQ